MEKIRKFLLSPLYTLTLFAGACAVIFTGQELLGTFFFLVIIGLSMALTPDFTPALQATIFTICFAIRFKPSSPRSVKLWPFFVRFWPFLFPICFLIAFHFLYYRNGLKRGSCFNAVFAVSVAVALGGLGVISPKEYFNPVALMYTFSLGFGTLIVYWYMCAALKTNGNYVFSERFAKLMTSAIFFLCVCLFEEYVRRRNELKGGFGILPFQWRNNASTILMLAMPFPFYLSVKKYAYFGVGLLSYLAILLSGSRGGMIFGLAELVVCIAVAFVIDKRRRPATLIISLVCVAAAVITRRALFDMLSYTIWRLFNPDENAIRLRLVSRGIEDFRANPPFGRGLGYMGNRDVHRNASFTLCWYHCSPIQIIGSFGLVGVAAYSYLIYARIRVLIRNFTFFNIMVFLSYIGVEMMSFVNPGVFVPFPYLFFVTIYFAVMENCNDENDKKALRLLIKGEYDAKKKNIT